MHVKIFRALASELEREMQVWMEQESITDPAQIVSTHMAVDPAEPGLCGEVVVLVYWRTHDEVASELPF